MKEINLYFLPVLFCVLLAGLPGCVWANIDMQLFKDGSFPLEEYVLQGSEEPKVLLIPIQGSIDNETEQTLMATKPSLVQETVAHLAKAQRDPEVKAVVLQINSPGGSVTASDILHQELLGFKQRRPDVKVVAAMMDTAASGGYYLAAACDRIVAHPTSVTGSIGVIFLRADLSGLMEKIGAQAVVTKSGVNKDMGTPFRPPTAEENVIFQDMIDEYHERFVQVVAKGRGMPTDKVRTLADGRIYTGEQAVKNGLVDRVGYLEDSVNEARQIAGLSRKAKLVVYRRKAYADDNPYNTATMNGGDGKLIDLGLDNYLPAFKTGFYYLWLPELE
jgi:protease-4